jgi:hypothetical protein
MASFVKRSDYHARLVRWRSLDGMACADNPLPDRAASLRGRVQHHRRRSIVGKDDNHAV